MENASKALIIAGAILLSILLISLGIMIYNKAEEIAKGTGLDEASLQAFNQKFLKHEGNIKGSEVRSLVQEVLANNNGSEASDETYVSINASNGSVTGDSAKMDATVIKLEVPSNSQADPSPTFGNTFKNTKTYNVSFKYSKGRIAIIQIK